MPNSVTNWIIGLGNLGARSPQASPPVIPPVPPSNPGPTIPLSAAEVGKANYTPIQSPLGTYPRFTTPTSVWYGIGNSSGTLPTSYPGQSVPSPAIGIPNNPPTPVGPEIGKRP